LKGFAATLGLNTSQFNDCLDGQKDAAQVTADIAEANKKWFPKHSQLCGWHNSTSWGSAYAQFQAAIDAALAK